MLAFRGHTSDFNFFFEIKDSKFENGLDGLNWYLYVGNNPLVYVDPTGLAEDNGDGTFMMNNFPVIDNYKLIGNSRIAKEVTSIKSLDINAKSYSKGKAIYNILMKYGSELTGNRKLVQGKEKVKRTKETIRKLEVVIPSGRTNRQMNQITQAAEDLSKKGVTLNINIIE